MSGLASICLLLCVAVASPSFIPAPDANTVTNIKETLNQELLHFLIAGDFGGWPPPFYTTPTQHTVAGEMGKVATAKKTNFVIANGDNFYFLGVKDEKDERFKLTYEDVYTSPALYVPWYPTMGNHDWHGNAQAQLDYSHISSRWTYPWYWYSLDFTLTPTNTTIRIIMMDTTIQCGINSEGTPINGTIAEMQWTWVEEQLESSQSFDYVIVVGHFPVLAAGNTGPTISCLYDRLRPLLDQYKVSAYIAGHEHNLQHLKDNPASNTEYFVVGCSNFVTPRFKNKDATDFQAQFTWAEMDDLGGGFARVEITKDRLKMIFIQGRDGQEIYSYDVMPRQK